MKLLITALAMLFLTMPIVRGTQQDLPCVQQNMFFGQGTQIVLPPLTVRGWIEIDSGDNNVTYFGNSLETFTWDHIVREFHFDIMDRFQPHYDVSIGKAFIAGGRVWSADHMYKLDPWLGTDVHLIGKSPIEGLTISKDPIVVGDELYIRTRRGVVSMVLSENPNPLLQLDEDWWYQVRFVDPEVMFVGGDSGSPVLRADTQEVVAIASGFWPPLPPVPTIIAEGEEEGDEAVETIVSERYGFIAILQTNTFIRGGPYGPAIPDEGAEEVPTTESDK